VNTSELEQELELLNAQIGQVRGTLSVLDGELRATEAELETITDDRLRFDALREACTALSRLEKLEAGQLFWGDLAGLKDRGAHLSRLQGEVARFDAEISGTLERQANLQRQINEGLEELECLYDEIHDAHARDERRKEEFIIEREISDVPEYQLIMPWSEYRENERSFRRAMANAMFFSLLLAIVVRVVHLPEPVRPVVVEIPKRLAMMVRKEQKKPEPVKKEAKKEEKKDLPKEQKPDVKKQVETVQAQPKQERPKMTMTPTPTPERAAARKNAENKGVLAFKESFKDLIEETPVARLGVEARVTNSATQSAGHAVASRSLVAMQSGGGSSGGIGNASVSRNVGGGRGNDTRLGRGGEGGFSRVESGIAGIGTKEKVASSIGTKEGKKLTSGGGPARTDEEIQILFDRYKAALYRIYNTELRKNPALRGKMVLRLAIEPSGAVSACEVESSNMNAPDFSAQIVERVRKFNFGPKDGVPKTTILYPIDFLPAR
jgi:hypothetical protein